MNDLKIENCQIIQIKTYYSDSKRHMKRMNYKTNTVYLELCKTMRSA